MEGSGIDTLRTRRQPFRNVAVKHAGVDGVKRTGGFASQLSKEKSSKEYHPILWRRCAIK